MKSSLVLRRWILAGGWSATYVEYSRIVEYYSRNDGRRYRGWIDWESRDWQLTGEINRAPELERRKYGRGWSSWRNSKGGQGEWWRAWTEWSAESDSVVRKTDFDARPSCVSAASCRRASKCQINARKGAPRLKPRDSTWPAATSNIGRTPNNIAYIIKTVNGASPWIGRLAVRVNRSNPLATGGSI